MGTFFWNYIPGVRVACQSSCLCRCVVVDHIQVICQCSVFSEAVVTGARTLRVPTHREDIGTGPVPDRLCSPQTGTRLSVKISLLLSLNTSLSEFKLVSTPPPPPPPPSPHMFLSCFCRFIPPVTVSSTGNRSSINPLCSWALLYFNIKFHPVLWFPYVSVLVQSEETHWGAERWRQGVKTRWEMRNSEFTIKSEI